MGQFWDNAAKEFGKKTGKALGNKLYGKHADDVRKRVTWVNESSSVQPSVQPTVDYGAIERAKQSTLEYEHDKQLLDTNVAIQFNTKDVDCIIKNLTFFSSSVDLWLTQSDKKKHAMAARSQFKTGLAGLNIANAEHPMLTHFTDKEQEWQAYAEKQRKRDIILYSTLAGLLVAFIIFIIIMANL